MRLFKRCSRQTRQIFVRPLQNYVRLFTRCPCQTQQNFVRPLHPLNLLSSSTAKQIDVECWKGTMRLSPFPPTPSTATYTKTLPHTVSYAMHIYCTPRGLKFHNRKTRNQNNCILKEEDHGVDNISTSTNFGDCLRPRGKNIRARKEYIGQVCRSGFCARSAAALRNTLGSCVFKYCWY